MFSEQTLEKLSELRLHGMAKALQQLQSTRSETPLDADEVVGLLVDGEYTCRENNKLSARLRRADFKYKDAALENIIYRADRGFSKSAINELRSSRWVASHKTVVLAGATGAGKSWMACALGNKACRDGYTVLYKRTTRLLEELAMARAQGKYAVTLKALAKANVLILDDFCMMPLGAADRRDLFEILEERYGNAATVIASQLEPDQWHAAIGDATFADSICDRLVHGAHRLHMLGESIRKVLAETPSPVGPKEDKNAAEA